MLTYCYFSLQGASQVARAAIEWYGPGRAKWLGKFWPEKRLDYRCTIVIWFPHEFVYALCLRCVALVSGSTGAQEGLVIAHYYKLHFN